jgi:flagellar biosynthesis protein FlhB
LFGDEKFEILVFLHLSQNVSYIQNIPYSIQYTTLQPSKDSLPPFQLLQRILYIVSDMMNVSSIMVKTVAALVVVAALISTRFSSEVGGVSVDDTLRIILNPLPLLPLFG